MIITKNSIKPLTCHLRTQCGISYAQTSIKHFHSIGSMRICWAFSFTSCEFSRRSSQSSIGSLKHILIESKWFNLSASRKLMTIHSLDTVPSWPEFTHFASLTHTDFSDGGKWADLSKVSIFRNGSPTSTDLRPLLQIIIQCCYSLFPPETTAYGLLKVMRKYVECDTYASLSVQTSETLEDYDTTIQQFGSRLSVSHIK